MTVYTSTTTDATGWMVQHICPRCGGSHHIEQCPQVKAIEYDERHRIKRIEFLTPGDYVQTINIKPTFKPPYDITATVTQTAQADPNWHKTWTMSNCLTG
jgi:hypothetical protein